MTEKEQKQHPSPIGAGICRTPYFHLDRDLESAWPELKTLISQSAPDFYERIRNLSYDELLGRDERTRFTVWKYFNRARYRATPLGSFAAVSLIPPNPSKEKRTLTIFREMDVFAVTRNLSEAIFKGFKAGSSLGLEFIANSTYYVMESEIRYLSLQQNRYALSSIPFTDEIGELLNFCSSKKTYIELIDFLQNIQGMDIRNARSTLGQLVDSGAILTEKTGSVTGGFLATRIPLEETSGRELKYVISSRKIAGSGLSREILDKVLQYAIFLSKTFPIKPNIDLEEFKVNFNRRWENRAVPLSTVLDPIYGIGYGNLGSAGKGGPYDLLGIERMNRPGRVFQFDGFVEFLLRELVKGEAIRLENFRADLQNAPGSLPNTFSAILQTFQGCPVIRSIGGYSSSSLSGRFSTLPDFEPNLREIARLEKLANPGITFFDLAYLSGEGVDHINWRLPLFEGELPFACWPSMDSPVRLQDILVSVDGERILLHHAPTGKRMVPRFASAYNYRRSELPHFRFLMDIQGQDLHLLQLPVMNSLLPGLDHYPRIVYRDCIIEPAVWRCPAFSSRSELAQWISTSGPNGPFLVGNYDQTLMIDPNKEEDLTHFLTYCKKNPAPLVKEALISQEGSIRDEEGLPYFSEYVVDFFHGNTVYENIPLRESKRIQTEVKSFHSDWIYIELFMNQSASDGFIFQELKEFLKSASDWIQLWFFVRYNDPSPHIRLRIRKRFDRSDALKDIGEYFAPLRDRGIITGITIREYEREIQRYGPKAMSHVEKFFHMDSVNALRDINRPTKERYARMVNLIWDLTQYILPDIIEREKFYRAMAGYFAKEMDLQSESWKKVNLFSSDFSMEGVRSANKAMVGKLRTIMRHTPEMDRRKMLSDLFHMAINRRFSSEQRAHEGIIYQIVHRLAKVMLHKERDH